jgi:hypothetical protein
MNSQPEAPLPAVVDSTFRPSPDDLVMNAYLLTHPTLDVQQWFEEQITDWGVHPMAEE